MTAGKGPSTRWFHVHRVAHRETIGVWSYSTCRCGARRVSRHLPTGYSPVVQDWPRPALGASDSGWHA